MTTDPRFDEDSPFARLVPKLKGLGRLWVQVVGAAVLVSLLFGPFAPLALVAILLTLGLPILALVLWGRSLDAELRWSDRDEGPW